MSDQYVGEIRLVAFNFAPVGWALCDGQLLPIDQYQAVFALLGTFYGGDGVTTFALPNLQSRVPIHQGQGEGLSPYVIGQLGGVEVVTLTTPEIPAHTHAIAQAASDQEQDTNRASGAYPTTGGIYASTAGSAPTLASSESSSVGGGQPHPNIQPFLTLNFIIALEGIFPSRS